MISPTRCKYFWTTAASLLYFISLVSAAPRNVTIDDKNGDSETDSLPTYISYWIQGPCDPCNNKPDENRAFDGTWHDVTLQRDPVGLELRFSGTAITAYFIIGQPVGMYTNTQLDISLDGQPVGSYEQPPSISAGDNYLYNVPVYASANLSPGEHTLTLMGKRRNENESVSLLFDYAVYTTDDEPASGGSAGTGGTGGQTSGSGNGSNGDTQQQPSNTSKSDTAIIAGAVVGGLVALSLLALALYFYIRRRQRSNRPTIFDKGIIAPFMVQRNSQIQSSAGGSTGESPVSPTMRKHLMGTRWIETEPTESSSGMSSVGRAQTTAESSYLPVDAEMSAVRAASGSGLGTAMGMAIANGSGRDRERRSREKEAYSPYGRDWSDSQSGSDRQVSYVQTPSPPASSSSPPPPPPASSPPPPPPITTSSSSAYSSPVTSQNRSATMPHSASTSDATVSDLRRELVGVQAELGNLRNELQTLAGIPPPGYVR